MTLEEEVKEKDWLNVTADEDVIDAQHPSLWAYLPQILSEAAVALGGLVGLIMYYDVHEYVLYGGLAAMFLGTLMVVITEYKRRCTWYVLTDEEVYHKEGVVAVSTRQARYDDIQDVTAHQSVIERILGYGHIHMTTAGSATTEFVLVNSPKTSDTKEVIINHVDAAAERVYRNDTQAGEDSHPDSDSAEN